MTLRWCSAKSAARNSVPSTAWTLTPPGSVFRSLILFFGLGPIGRKPLNKLHIGKFLQSLTIIITSHMGGVKVLTRARSGSPARAMGSRGGNDQDRTEV